jgi:hypothetical protein
MRGSAPIRRGLIKALEQVLTEAEAARKAEGDAARREVKSKEKAEAERLRQERREQSRKRGEEKTDKTSLGETIPQARSRGVVSLIAGLPSNADWRIPIAATALLLLGWILPGYVFMSPEQGGFGWGTVALLYGLAGFVAIGVAFYVRRSALGGADLSITILAQTPSYLPIAALAILMAAWLITVRRNAIGGLEFAVYWLGFTLILYAAEMGLVTSTFFRATELGAFFEVRPNRAPAILLLSVIVSALAILAWRNRRLSRPELAIYLLGIAYALYGFTRLA